MAGHSDLRVDERERARIAQIVRSQTEPYRVKVRAEIIQRLAAGQPVGEVADSLRLSTKTVRKWRSRYETAGLEGILADAPRPGRPRRIGADREEWILQEARMPPVDRPVWRLRPFAEHLGLPFSTVRLVLQRRGLGLGTAPQPAIRGEPRLQERLHDLVGLDLRGHAVAFALRSDAEAGATAGHDPGEEPLVTASGEGPRAFMKRCVRRTPAGHDLHLLLAHPGMDALRAMQGSLAPARTVRLHVTPAPGPWQGLSSRLLRDLARSRAKRHVFPSAPRLEVELEGFATPAAHDPGDALQRQVAARFLSSLRQHERINRTMVKGSVTDLHNDTSL